MTDVMLALDYMAGIADQSYARAAVRCAAAAVKHARDHGVPVVFSKIGFLPGHPEVSPRNRTFGVLIGTDRLVGDQSRLVEALTPRSDEPVINKKRFSALAGNDLWMLLRAREVKTVALCGLSTGGVVLSTALELIDADYAVTVLSDACADPDAGVHDTVLRRILHNRADIRTVDEWASEASGSLRS